MKNKSKEQKSGLSHVKATKKRKSGRTKATEELELCDPAWFLNQKIDYLASIVQQLLAGLNDAGAGKKLPEIKKDVMYG